MRVSSALTSPAVNVNTKASPAAAAGVSVSTVLHGGVEKLKFMRKKGDEINSHFHLRVAYEDDSADNLDKVYNEKPSWLETVPVSDSVYALIAHSVLQTNLGLATGKKFMEANLKVSAIASTNSVISSGSRQSAPVAVSYSAKSAPGLALADFAVERLPSTLRVSLKGLTADKLGGFATLPVKIRATHSTNATIVYGNTQNDILTLGSALTIDFGAMVSGSYNVECEVLDIQGEEFKVAKAIPLGKYTPGSALLAAKKFKVARKVGSAELVVSWEAVAADDWTSNQKLYVTGEDAAGKTIWYSQPAVNPTTGALLISNEETAHGATLVATGTTINRLPIGKKITVVLETSFTHSTEATQVVRVSDYDVPSGAPEFKALEWDSTNGVLKALVAHNGVAIKQFMLLAGYAAGKPLGKVLMNVDLTGFDSIADVSADSVVRYLIAFDQSKPMPSGILAILMNENGVDVNADPATFGGAVVAEPIDYDAAVHKTFKTSAN